MIKKKCPECGNKIAINFWNHYWKGYGLSCNSCSSFYYYRRAPGAMILVIFIAVAIASIISATDFFSLNLPRHQRGLIYMLVGVLTTTPFFYIIGKFYNPQIGTRKMWWRKFFSSNIAYVLEVALVVFMIATDQFVLVIPLLLFLIGSELNLLHFKKTADKAKRSKLSNMSFDLNYEEIKTYSQRISDYIEQEKYLEAVKVATELNQHYPNNYYSKSLLAYAYERKEFCFDKSEDSSTVLIQIERELFLETRVLKNHYIGWCHAIDYYFSTNQFRKVLCIAHEYSKKEQYKYIYAISLANFHLRNQSHPRAKWMRRKSLKMLKGYFGDKYKNEYAWKLRERIKKAT